MYSGEIDRILGVVLSKDLLEFVQVQEMDLFINLLEGGQSIIFMFYTDQSVAYSTRIEGSTRNKKEYRCSV